MDRYNYKTRPGNFRLVNDERCQLDETTVIYYHK